MEYGIHIHPRESGATLPQDWRQGTTSKFAQVLMQNEGAKMKRIDVAYVLIVNELEDRVLMVRNVDNRMWTLPGRNVEPGETLVEAARREAYEEAGVIVETGEIVSVNECTLTQYGEHALFFTFRARLVDGEPHIVRPEEISAVEWVDLNTANGYLSYHPGGITSLLNARCPYIDEGIK